jgi:hypothetical protein
VYFGALAWIGARSDPGRERVPAGWLIGGLLATAWYAARVFFDPLSSEAAYAISRILLLAIIISLFTLYRGLQLEVILKTYSWGFIALSVLVVFIGITGYVLIEPPRPGRSLGLEVPWFKTPGVPRSFGEQGIIVSLMLAYVLGYWRRLYTPHRWLLLGGCIAVTVMGQSRNMILAALVVSATLVFVANRRRWTLLRLCVVGAVAATFLLEQILPSIANTGVGSALIGEGIYMENVETRFALIDGVTALIQARPFSAIAGFDHADWIASEQSLEEAGVHNHFVGTLIFFGVPAGALMLWAVFFAPAWRILNQLSSGILDPEAELRARVLISALCGVFVSLNFYEGFFSLTLGIVCALLWCTAAIRGERSPEAPLRR